MANGVHNKPHFAYGETKAKWYERTWATSH